MPAGAGAGSRDRPLLSVIVATLDASRSIDDCIRRLAESCAALESEIIVVDPSMGVGALVPELWAEGYRRARGRIVAFTIGQCRVTPAWARALVDAIEHGATGAGGPLAIAADAGPLDWAVSYLRYSAFTVEALGSGNTDGEIAGDNAAYRREALDRHAAAFDDGFWEIDFHRLVRADGGWLTAVPEARVEFGASDPLGTMVRHRFAHGRRFGAGRARTRSRLRLVAAAPFVPAVLAARAAARVAGRRADRWRFLAALPWFLVLATAWAAGEARGAMA